MDMRDCLYATVDLLLKHENAACHVVASPSQDVSRERLGRLVLVIYRVAVCQAIVHPFSKCLGSCLMFRLDLASPEEDDQKELCFARYCSQRRKYVLKRSCPWFGRRRQNFLHFLRDASIRPCLPTTII